MGSSGYEIVRSINIVALYVSWAELCVLRISYVYELGVICLVECSFSWQVVCMFLNTYVSVHRRKRESESASKPRSPPTKKNAEDITECFLHPLEWKGTTLLWEVPRICLFPGLWTICPPRHHLWRLPKSLLRKWLHRRSPLSVGIALGGMVEMH